MIVRIAAIVFIFICTTAAWFILGGTVIHRTDESDTALRSKVGRLWGTAISQQAPSVQYTVHRPGMVTPANGKTPKPGIVVHEQTGRLEASDINVRLHLEHRQKGLLWYATYRTAFRGRYTLANPEDSAERFTFTFRLPGSNAIYDNFRMSVGGQVLDAIAITDGTIEESFSIPAGGTQEVVVEYETGGMDDWWYTLGDNVSQVRNFSLTVHTDFADVDFPDTGISPTAKRRTATGWELRWTYASLLSGVQIGIGMPEKLNPGPWVSQVTFFAPIPLFLFFFLLFMVTTIRTIPLHPINYFFLSAAFFSFHLLLAYLVDHLSVHLSFAIASVVSIALVVSYMRIVVGARFALVEVGLAQCVYLVLFSYTFFFPGYTGLSITLVCVATLFIVMQATARIDWEELFARESVQRTLRRERIRQGEQAATQQRTAADTAQQQEAPQQQSSAE